MFINEFFYLHKQFLHFHFWIPILKIPAVFIQPLLWLWNHEVIIIVNTIIISWWNIIGLNKICCQNRLTPDRLYHIFFEIGEKSQHIHHFKCVCFMQRHTLPQKHFQFNSKFLKIAHSFNITSMIMHATSGSHTCQHIIVIRILFHSGDSAQHTRVTLVYAKWYTHNMSKPLSSTDCGQAVVPHHANWWYVGMTY